jgi:hypothetical protein
MSCKICGGDSELQHKAVLLNKYDVSYFRCRECGFLQTEDPYWLKEAYGDPIHISDTGILARNLHLSRIAATVIFFIFGGKGPFLDYAGGYGIFTRLMRDIGFDFYWSDAHAKNIFARGFEYRSGGCAPALITSFESFEHFVDPMAELRGMSNICRNILFSTEVLPGPVPAPSKWWYYVREHGQHISFYSLASLRRMAAELGLRFYTNGRDVHIFTCKKLNPALFKALTLGCRYGPYQFVKRSMKSMTFVDHERLLAAEKRVDA